MTYFAYNGTAIYAKVDLFFFLFVFPLFSIQASDSRRQW